MNATRRVAKVAGWVLGIALVILLLIGGGVMVIQFAGGAVGDMTGSWTGVYDSNYAPANDTANFSTLDRCQAWGKGEVAKNGGSYKCGRDCKDSTTFNTLECTELYP